MDMDVVRQDNKARLDRKDGAMDKKNLFTSDEVGGPVNGDGK